MAVTREQYMDMVHGELMRKYGHDEDEAWSLMESYSSLLDADYESATVEDLYFLDRKRSAEAEREFRSGKLLPGCVMATAECLEALF